MTATYKDWRGGLVVFGVVLILLGCLWLCQRIQQLSGYSPDLLQQSQQLTGPGFEVLSVLAGMVAVLGYLVWVRRYFAGPAQDRACQAAPAVPL